MGKRANVGQAKGAAKAPKRDPSIVGVEQGIHMAVEANLLDSSVSKMLEAMVAGAFGTPAADRHETQIKVIKMLEETMQSVTGHLQGKLDEASGEVTNLESSKGELDGKAKAAADASSEASNAADSAASALVQAGKDLKERESALKGKRAAEKKAEKSLSNATAAQATFAGGVDSHFKPLQSGEFGETSPEAHKDSLIPLLKGAGIEESLFLAFPSSCVKTLSDRTSFDTMVFQEVAKAVEASLETLGKDVAEAASAVESCAAETKTAEQAVEDASSAKQAAEAALEQATAKKVEAAELAAQAQGESDNFEPTFKKAVAAKDGFRAELENFTVYNIGCLELLRDGSDASVAASAGA